MKGKFKSHDQLLSLLVRFDKKNSFDHDGIAVYFAIMSLL